MEPAPGVSLSSTVNLSAAVIFFFSSRRRHTRYWRDWSSEVCSSDLHLSESEFSRRVNAHGAVHRGTLARANVRILEVGAEQTEPVLAALQNDPDIEFAERDYLAHACTMPNDPYVVSGSEWHLGKIQA